MITTKVIIESNKLPDLIALLPSMANDAVREQAMTSKADVMSNIVKYNAIDTGTMLGSVYEMMNGQHDAEVGVRAQSAEGYPYPVAVNYGTVNVSPRPFFSEAVAKAQREFPDLVSQKIRGVMI